ncbi:hypothetical protein BCR32DRAFT_330440 [Anaeromyces robustus]|jgi:hypothetical protein|uniref:Uncharacterized protein n=1 Tax=Anaeromyces robustus TaxID=1754192 RepID=A0A1Y1VVN0_9FUNG|nr:hypothetical protein BCR32DRAFT_330440 [Anaeromyces robustus]|eukprot:ORX65065.1 hypothetical protein BCR32DRAFT_330440 [Anaeromyces robustus]
MFFNFYILLSIIILLQVAKGITLSKEEVLKLNLKEYNSTNCPEFSNGISSFDKNYCSYNFYCLDNYNCQSDKDINSKYFEFTDKDGNTKKYIKKICTEPKYPLDECTTEKCTSDSDCLSNNCFNSTCISGGKSLFTECTDVWNNIDSDNQFQIMKCGKPHGEECKVDAQCAGICFDYTCSSHDKLVQNVPIHLEYLFYIIGGIVILLIFLCICCCCMCC